MILRERARLLPQFVGAFILFASATLNADAVKINVRGDRTIVISNAHIELTFNPENGDSPQHITAPKADAPRPFHGSISSGPLFVHCLEVNGKLVPRLVPKEVKRSAAAGRAVLEFQSVHESLVIERRYTIESKIAGFSDNITLRNDGNCPIAIRLGENGDISGFDRDAPDFQHWAWKVMRWYTSYGDSLEMTPVHYLQEELRDNAVPIIREMHSADGRLQFGFINGRALGLFISLESESPLTFRTLSDRFLKKDGGRCDEIRGRWSWQSDSAVNIAPAESVSLSRKVFLLDGQGLIEKQNGNGLVAALDCPPYRDPGDQIEASAYLGSDRDRLLQLMLLIKGDDDEEGKIHETRNVELKAGKTCRISFNHPLAVGPQMRLVVVAKEAGAKPMHLEKTVVVGCSTVQGRHLAEQYHKAYPLAADFHGSLIQFGAALIDPKKRLRVGDGYPPDVSLRRRQMADDAAAQIGRKFNLNDPDIKRFAQHALECYKKWFPNYTKILRGKAAALRLPIEMLVLDEQSRFDETKTKAGQLHVPDHLREADMGCIDIAFRTAEQGRIWLTWNKDRATIEGGVPIEYERCLIEDGLSFHGIANYGVNESGFAVAGAALNENPTVIQEGLRLVESRRAAGKAFGPPDPMMVLLAECRTVDDAARLISNPDAPLVWGGGNCLMADRQGGVFAWQASGLKRLLRKPDADWRYFTATNYPHDWTINPPDKPDESGRITMTAWFREANLRRIMKGFPGSPELSDVFAVLRDRSEPGAIEQVHWNSPKASMTVMSFVIDTKTSDLYIAYSPASRHKYLRYEMKKEAGEKP